MNIKKQQYIFLWDLHEVVFYKSFLHWIKIGLQFDHKKELIKNSNSKIIALLYAYLLEKIGLSYEQKSAQELIDLAKKQNNQVLIDFIIRLCCAYKPIDQTVEIIKTLHAQGYKQHIGSNIARSVYDSFKQMYTDIFSLFQAAVVVESSTEKGTIKKPNTLFFFQHLERHNLQPEQIIFIDDKEKNIQSAESIGMIGIQFKNARQLKEELKKRGFLL